MEKNKGNASEMGFVVLWIVGIVVSLALMLGILNQLLKELPVFREIGKEAPEVSARAAVVMDLDTGEVLYEKNGDVKMYPASTTKILTVLLGIEYGLLERDVMIGRESAGVEGSSIYLEEGEVISFEDLLYGAMLRSGNDAATAIAVEIGGTVEGFVELMNRRAMEMGVKNTRFQNPTGLHQEEHYTTAKDMALMGKRALENPVFAEIARTKIWMADRENDREERFENKNKVVHQYQGGTGVKIGYTQASGRTLVASSSREGRALLCVVMDAPNWFEDAYQLMDWAYENGGEG